MTSAIRFLCNLDGGRLIPLVSKEGPGDWPFSDEWAAIPRLSKAGCLCASKIPEMRTDGAVSNAAKPPYRFPRSAPYGIKEASRLFTNRPVCANKDAARHLFNGAATPPWKGGEWPCFQIVLVL